MVNRLAG